MTNGLNEIREMIGKMENLLSEADEDMNTQVEEINHQIKERDDKIYDLEERTAKFGEDIIDFVRTLSRNPINDVFIRQVVRSGTSIGANYMEADVAESKRDFKHKISLCRKESKETKHWFRMIAKANPAKSEPCRVLWKEAQELTLIFSSILKSSSQ